jgi:hypothetical protein
MYIEPFNDHQAAVTYEIVAEPDIVAPKSQINKGVRRSAASVVHAIRQRVNELHRLGLLHPIVPAAPAVAAKPAVLEAATLKARR